MSSAKTTASILKDLIQTCKDGEEGFRNAAVGVEKRELKELFAELSIQREQFAQELDTLASSLDEPPEHAGKLTEFLHRSWIDLKGAVMMGNELAILTECVRRVDYVLEQYRAAMDDPEVPSHIRETIQKQALEIQAAHDRVRDLHERFASGGAG
jgi:uncharacterized protein (TIGR02284 family)